MNWDYYNAIYSSPRFQQLWGRALWATSTRKALPTDLFLVFRERFPNGWGSGHLNVGSEDEWAEMVASLIYYARNTQHLQFSIVDPANEPDVQPQGFALPGGASQYVTMLHSLSAKLDAFGMSDIRFFGAGTGDHGH